MIQNNFLVTSTRTGLMDVYVSAPYTENSLPIVLVFQEAFGVNHHIRSVCDRLAQKGFIAVAPELFHREGRRIVIPYSERKEFMPLLGRLNNKDIVSDVKDTIDFLKTLPWADTSNISTVGFCVGGFSAILAATEIKFRKAISFYGAGMVSKREGIGVTPILNKLSGIRCPCLFFFGGADVSIPRSEIKQIEKILLVNEIPFEVDIFERSDHGFFCEERKSYDPVGASSAWKKTLDFLTN